MKKWMMLLLALLLCVPALAEESPAIPVEVVEERAQNQIEIGLNEAIEKAMAELPVQPEKYQTRAEVVRMSDDTYRWIVTVFDLTTLTDGWCVELDVSTGAVLASYTTKDGFFWEVYNAWTERKDPRALWSLEDKQLYDKLYAVLPAYGLPMPGDIAAEEALKKALTALGMDDAGGYQVGYGYLMGGDGYNGVWEICLVVDGEVDAQVNLDAVTGEIYYLDMYLVEADGANG